MTDSLKPLLIVITGPTGVGKTDTAIRVASHFNTEIVSADSRQIYRDLPVTTAAPTPSQLSQVKHHLVGSKSLETYYSASVFEQEALAILKSIFKTNRVAVVCGGSMMYIDALCNGIDEIPTISDTVRENVQSIYKYEGLETLLRILQGMDPEYYAIVDRNNVKRVMHAVEICMESGTTYSSLRKGVKTERPFQILKCMLTAPRDILFERINRRTEEMVRNNMIEEIRKVIHLRHLNSLNTVGVKEMLRYLDGEWTLEEAIARLQKNTRVYAKKQLTWFARDKELVTIDLTESDPAEIIIKEADRLLR